MADTPPIIICDDIRANPAHLVRPIITIGSFDGVHLGHQRILTEVTRLANEHHGDAAVLTTRPHPREFFNPRHAPNLLTSDAYKTRLLAQAGIQAVLWLPFDQQTAALSPEHFARYIIHEQCAAAGVVVGHDFRFGYKASGDFHLLYALGKQFGFFVKQVEPLLIKGERVSSTVIRERILQGDLEEAESLLGRKYAVSGEVISGRGIGRTLGFPTANIKPFHSALPAQGVYAAQAFLNGQSWPAAVNIGIAPTIRQEDLTIEAFLIGFHGDILHSDIELVFYKRIRSEQKFASREELTQQIARDVEYIRRLVPVAGNPH